MHLIAIGRLRSGPEADLFERYNIRLRPRLTIAELAEERGTPTVVKRKEGAALLAALPRDAFVVPLDLGGYALDSESFAGRLGQWATLSRPVCFLIGGAEGLDAPVIARADYLLSLGTMTWPHFLVRAMLAEQLYRAQAIAQGHPYHRAGRPEA
ncbi:23S rRNA (pseudouridine(1915)-N(3))-methyltransferase RlmH [Acidisphaera sp. S103]|uniref:23S rRNA (pseudouridine(1915)-N(3))-methyltransferase RlmH n=1 Tax=Acidisphaera sp. S103 TaxID=1747223 RepID=UPI00131ECC28|nr:23S rRNA (pseudouridine(1915)-N(3))-methyltransferase RlmH [Acidisphaera sp. S103]